MVVGGKCIKVSKYSVSNMWLPPRVAVDREGPAPLALLLYIDVVACGHSFI